MKRINDRSTILFLHLIAVALLVLAVHVRGLPATPTAIPEEGSAESHWWGLWPVTYLPDWLFFGGLGLIALVVIAAVIFAWGPVTAQRARLSSTANEGHQQQRQWGYRLIMVGFAAAFFAFPIVHTRWGDAYILTKAIAHPDPAIQLTHSWQAPLDLYLHSSVWHYFHGIADWQDAMPVYHLLSPVAGFLYMSATYAISRTSRHSFGTPQWLTFGLLTSLGVMQLFFGYIENYSFAAAGIVSFLWLALRTLQGQSPLWLAALVLALTNALHPSTIVYWPAMLWLGWQVRCTQADYSPTDSRGRNNSLLGIVYQLIVPPVVVAAATIAMMEIGGHGLVTLLTTDRPGGGDARWLVPLWATTTRWERYIMISWPHLRDILNEQLLVAPILLPAIGVALLQLAVRRSKMSGHVREEPSIQRSHSSDLHAIVLLAVAANCHLLLTWIWNPDYGGQRDWDLFSLAAIPTALLAAQLLHRLIRDPRALLAGMIPLLMLQYAQLATWVYQNTLPWEWP
ncbi:MAG TPA: hypothetical protein P5121_23580 [Caldilineaceae bacterium]|nr:hypothetical protein [Caldilineaceae bacterium]